VNTSVLHEERRALKVLDSEGRAALRDVLSRSGWLEIGRCSGEVGGVSPGAEKVVEETAVECEGC
jgi:hypothetical protein